MDDLIIRVLSGTASPFEEERLKRWREESEEHEATFQDIARVWELTAPEPPAVVPEKPTVETILARAAAIKSGGAEGAGGAPPKPEGGPAKPGTGSAPSAARPEARPAPHGTGSGSPDRTRLFPAFRRRWWLLAASVAGLSLAVQVIRTRGPEAVAVYDAPEGQTLTVSLRDGSLVRLREGARLQEWEADARRLVSLEGQAFFAVARDPATPFVVRASGGQVQVLGTRFELRSEAGSLRTVVVEGRVEVSNREGRVEVGAGEVAVARSGAPPTATTPGDIYELLDWPEGTLVFQATPLRLVAEEVTRFFGRPLVVRPGAMENRRITAWFQGESFDEVAEALCQTAGASCLRDGEGVTMDDPGGGGGTS